MQHDEKSYVAAHTDLKHFFTLYSFAFKEKIKQQFCILTKKHSPFLF